MRFPDRLYLSFLLIFAMTSLPAMDVQAEEGLYLLDRAQGLHRIGNTTARDIQMITPSAVDFEVTEDGRVIYALEPEGLVTSDNSGGRYKGIDVSPAQARRIAVSRLGYAILDGLGRVHFGDGQPDIGWNAYFGWDIARDVELTPDGDGMVVLDGFGGLHVRGNAPVHRGPFFGWDIARDLELSPDGEGYYILDGYGTIHPVGPVPPFSGVNLGWDIARDLEITQSGRGFYILDGFGGLHTGGDAIPFAVPYFGWDVATDLEIAPQPMGSLSGKVLAVNAAGEVKPIAGAMISLKRNDLPEDIIRPLHPGASAEAADKLGRLNTRSNSQGDYEFELLAAGIYSVRVDAPGFDQYTGEIEILAGQQNLQDFRLVAKGTTLPPAEFGSVKGTVAKDVGMLTVYIPIPNARVTLHITNRWSVTVRTNENGEFEFPRVPVGNHLIVAAAPGFLPDRDSITVEAGETSFKSFLLKEISTEPGRVFGKVWYESFADCTNDTDCIPSELPIAGARLHLIPQDAPIIMNPVDGTQVIPESGMLGWQTVSDEDGNYEFQDVRPGKYVLMAHAEGFAPARVEFSLGLDCPEPSETESLPCNEVEINIQMKPLVSQFGSLFGTVRGITDSTDSIALTTPLAGAVVHAIPLRWDVEPATRLPLDDQGNFPATDSNQAQRGFVQITDEYGRYRFEKIPPGRYEIVVSHRGYVSQRREVVLPPQTELEENFLLRPIQLSLGRIEGVVAGASLNAVTSNEVIGIPLEGAVVMLVPAPRPVEGDVPVSVSDALRQEIGTVPDLISDLEVSRRFRTVTTAADGSYAFENVPEGYYRLVAKSRGYMPRHKQANVFAEQTTTVNFLLRPVPPIQTGSLAGKVTDALSGSPVVRAVVTAWPLSTVSPVDQPNQARVQAPPATPEMDAQRSIRTFTDENGEYKFPRLPVGPIQITVRALDYEPARGHVRILPGQTVTLDFTLRPVPPTGSIVGLVTELTSSGIPGKPIPGALVTLIPWDIAVAEDAATGIVNEAVDPAGSIFRTKTNNRGWYEFPRVPAGRYIVLVQKPNYQPARRPVSLPAGETVRVDFMLRPVNTPPTGSIVGAVYSTATDGLEPSPIQGAVVHLVPYWQVTEAEIQKPDVEAARRYIAYTDEEGRFGFENVPVGRYIISAHARGHQSDFRRIEVLENEVIRVVFNLDPISQQPGARLFGWVTRQLGDDSTLPPPPIARVQMILFHLPEDFVELPELDTAKAFERNFGLPMLTTWTNQEGLYEFLGLPSGRYLLIALKEGFEIQYRLIGLENDESRQEDFQLAASLPNPAVFEGRIITRGRSDNTAGWLPVPNAEIILTPKSYATLVPIMVRTNAEGRFSFPNLIPDEYRVSITAEGFESQNDAITFKPSQVLRKEYVLNAVNTLPVEQGSFEGRLLTRNTRPAGSQSAFVPLPNASVLLTPKSYQTFAPIAAQTDEEGRFSFPRLLADEYRVTVSAPGYGILEDKILVKPNQVARKEYVLNPVVSLVE